MDKIKVGDVLKKGDGRITITEIYLFQMHPRDNFRPVVIYDWHNVKTDQIENGVTTFDMDWEGWEKV